MAKNSNNKDYSIGGTKQKGLYGKKIEEQWVTVKVLAGSLIIPPHKIKESFRKIFDAGIKSNELHPDNNICNNLNFKKSLDKLLKSFPKK